MDVNYFIFFFINLFFPFTLFGILFINMSSNIHTSYLHVFMIAGQLSGTTVTFVIIEGFIVTVASVGDSRCILESADGSLYYLSADHRFEDNEEE